MEQYFMQRAILRKYGRLSPSRILEYFAKDSFFHVLCENTSWTFIVLGRGGPTGKSWLCRELQNLGFTAIELSESILPLVEYRDNGNHVIADGRNNAVIIVLNHSLREEV